MAHVTPRSQFHCYVCALADSRHVRQTQLRSCRSRRYRHRIRAGCFGGLHKTPMKPVKKAQAARSNRPALLQLAYELFIAAAIIAASLGIVGWLILKGIVKPPIPYPAVNTVVNLYPPEIMPWQPRAPEGAFAPNNRLRAVRLFENQIYGSESVTVAPDGRLIMLDKYAWVREALQQPDGSYQLQPHPLAHLGPGRPLGAGFDAEGNLIICDALKGLVMLEKDTMEVRVLANRVAPTSPTHAGMPLIYTNDLDIASDGTVYFTTSINVYPHRMAQHDKTFSFLPSMEGLGGFYDTIKGWGLGMCQGLPKSFIMKYTPATQEVHVVADGFWYGNGVALSADEDFLAISETDRLRVVKLWLKGPKAGQQEVMIDHLPGSPDGISRAADGSFWLPMLVKIPDYTLKFASPVVRTMLPWLPEWWRPPVKEYGMVVKLSPEGEVLDYLEDSREPKPSAYRISSAHEHDGKLFFGNLVANFVSYQDLSQLPPFVPGGEAGAAPAAA